MACTAIHDPLNYRWYIKKNILLKQVVSKQKKYHDNHDYTHQEYVTQVK